MNGIPRIKEVRSITQFGFSSVTVVFEEGTDVYWARQLVNERLMRVREDIPEGFGSPGMGPIATGLSEIYLLEVRRAGREAEAFLDGVAHPPRLGGGRPAAGRARGDRGQHVRRRVEDVRGPARPQAAAGPRNLGHPGLRGAAANNGNAGGGYIKRNGQVRVIRAKGLVSSLKDIEEVVLDVTPGGTPIYVRDVGEVRFATKIRQGVVTRDGGGEVVTATVLLLAGENGRVVVNRVKSKLEEIRKALPEGVVIDSFYDRATLINKAITTVARNLAEGGVLVIVVLLVLLGNLRAGLIVALAIPLSMLFAGNLMLYFGIAGSLMSLGAIDFGLIVDGAVIVIENCVGRLSHARPGERAVDVIRRATLEVRRPVVYGVGIITLVHLPLLALEGVEGKMFRPMAATLISR